MSWKLKRKAQALLAGEEGQVHKDWGGRMSIALVYPNSYAVGMSNLGFQTIYEHLNAIPDVVCELVEAWRASGAEEAGDRRRRFLERLAGLAGIYVPGAYDIGYAGDGTIEAVTPRQSGAPGVIVKRRLRDVDAFETRSMLKTPKA